MVIEQTIHIRMISKESFYILIETSTHLLNKLKKKESTKKLFSISFIVVFSKLDVN